MPRKQDPRYSPSQLQEWRRSVVVGLIVAAILLGVPAIYFFNFFNASNPTLLCAACHEMRASYLTWEKSLHSDVACDKCHVVPFMGTMVTAKIKNPLRGLPPDKTIVPEEKCEDCHSDMPKEVVFHDIVIDHEKHIRGEQRVEDEQDEEEETREEKKQSRLEKKYARVKLTAKDEERRKKKAERKKRTRGEDEKGVKASCLECHKNLVHGENAAEKNIPSFVANCRKCHNSVTAVSSCGTCHPGFKGGTPSFDTVDWKEGHHFNAKEQRNECVRCHSRPFCYGCHVTEAPHKEGFDHVKQFKETIGQLCNNCHSFNFCNDCHSIKKQHKASGWTDAGHAQFKEKLATCEGSQCHSRQYCNECHEKSEEVIPLMDHSDVFKQSHPLFAAEDTPECSKCHINHFCISCHQEETFHPEGWSESHAARMNELAGGDTEQTPEDRCSTCHSADFCAKCHNSEGLVRASHGKEWKKGHEKAPESKTELCNACHAVGDCNECHEHKIVLPHDRKFLDDHKEDAEKLKEPCVLCHTTDFCISCHKSNEPETHNETWYYKHPKLTKKERQYCNQCHDEKQFCDLCHKSTVVKISHVEGWDEKHPVKDMDELKGCAQCHGFDTCALECHTEIEEEIAQKVEKGELPPIELEKGEDIEKRKEKLDHALCSKCHTDYLWTFGGIQSCAECHEEISSVNSLSEKHHDCNECHAPHTWKIESKNSCEQCHEHEDEAKLVTIKEHKADNCSACHYVEDHFWAAPAPFILCFDCHLKEDKLPAELHNIGAHGRCGDCHAPHDVTLKLPDICTQCHEDLPPERCEPDKPCTECHAFKRPEKKK